MGSGIPYFIASKKTPRVVFRGDSGGSPVTPSYPHPAAALCLRRRRSCPLEVRRAAGRAAAGPSSSPSFPISLSILSSPLAFLPPCALDMAGGQICSCGGRIRMLVGRPALHRLFRAGSGVGRLRPRRRWVGPWLGCGGLLQRRPRRRRAALRRPSRPLRRLQWRQHPRPWQPRRQWRAAKRRSARPLQRRPRRRRTWPGSYGTRGGGAR
jgi:hypothetical protein